MLDSRLVAQTSRDLHQSELHAVDEEVRRGGQLVHCTDDC